MSTADATLAVRRASMRIAVTDRVAVVALALLVVLLAGLTWSSWGDLGSDTGYDLVVGARVADGELPYRDFVYYYGPLAPAIAGLVALVGGAGLAPFVAFGLLVTAAIVAATYAVARLVARPLAAALAAAITAAVAFAPSNFSFVLPHVYSATLALLGTLLVVLGIGRHAASGSRAWLWTAGCAAGWVALARPESAIPVWLAAATWLALAMRARRAGRRELAALALPAIAMTVAAYGAAMAISSPSGLVWDNLVPRDELAAGGTHLVSISAPFTAASLATLVLRLALYAAGTAALVLIARRLDRRREAPVSTAAIAAAATALAIGAVALRPESVRYGLELVYGWIPLGAALAAAVVLWRYRRRGEEAWTPVAQAELVLSMILAVVAVRYYGAFFPHASEPQQAAYAIPLAAVFLAWLHDHELGRSAWTRRAAVGWLAFLALAGATLTVTDAREESARVAGPGGSVAESPQRAPLFQGALDAIARGSDPGDRILLAPQLSTLYTLSERSAPLPEISLLPGALGGPTAEREAVRRLDRAGVDLAVVNTRRLTEYGQGAFGETYDLILRDWLQREFRRTATLGNDDGASLALEIWQRRTT